MQHVALKQIVQNALIAACLNGLYGLKVVSALINLASYHTLFSIMGADNSAPMIFLLHCLHVVMYTNTVYLDTVYLDTAYTNTER